MTRREQVASETDPNDDREDIQQIKSMFVGGFLYGWREGANVLHDLMLKGLSAQEAHQVCMTYFASPQGQAHIEMLNAMIDNKFLDTQETQARLEEARQVVATMARKEGRD